MNLDQGAYDSPQKLYADVAHPINSECREMIQNAVIDEFEAELSRCQQPGYRSRYDDEFGYEDLDADDVVRTDVSAKHESGPPKPHFDDKPTEEPASDDDDSFGAGIF